ncbi:MAG: hypothetical protein IPH09_11290 [bacterium]|nr:hypothetical protein [bacterium]
MALDGLLLGLFALNRSSAGVLVLFALCQGPSAPGSRSTSPPFLQRETPPGRRGRIFGWLGPLLGPTLLSVLGSDPGLAVGGAGQVLVVAAIAEVVFGWPERCAPPVRTARPRLTLSPQLY